MNSQEAMLNECKHHGLLMQQRCLQMAVEIARLQEAVQDAVSKDSELRRDYLVLEDNFNSCVEENKDLEDRIQNKTDENEELRLMLDQYQSELDEVTDAVETLEEERAELRLELKVMKGTDGE